MDLDEQAGAGAPHKGGEGCLTVMVRIPVRIVVLLLVLPLRMVWDLLVASAGVLEKVLLRPLWRALTWVHRWLLVPAGRALGWLTKALLYWPWSALWRHVVVPFVRHCVVAPLSWLHRAVLTPLGQGLRWVWKRLLVPVSAGLMTVLLVWPAIAVWRYVLRPLGLAAGWLALHLLVLPARWVYRYVLTPAGRFVAWTADLVARALTVTARGLWAAAAWLFMTLLVQPLVWVWRRVLAPLGREFTEAVGVAWRIAGHLSRAVGRVLAWLAWHLIGAPVTWAYRSLCTPVGHFVRDAVWAPVKRVALEAGRAARAALASAREGLRAARRDAWRALVGSPQVTEARELEGSAARTLGRTTTVPSAAPAPEISPLDDKTVGRG
ncbi:hypothetical protein AB0D35_13455 [Streptomyces sp. NPDC048301]|uniref:hypothetical protein n=1 Tax=Streptomyces sp. NPDC048301 TaxID=3155631 RepID=UPI003412E231